MPGVYTFEQKSPRVCCLVSVRYALFWSSDHLSAAVVLSVSFCLFFLVLSIWGSCFCNPFFFYMPASLGLWSALCLGFSLPVCPSLQGNPSPNVVSGNHCDSVVLFHMESPNASLVLGHPWLVQHSPHVDWSCSQIMSRSQSCHACCLGVASRAYVFVSCVAGWGSWFHRAPGGVPWSAAGLQQVQSHLFSIPSGALSARAPSHPTAAAEPALCQGGEERAPCVLSLNGQYWLPSVSNFGDPPLARMSGSFYWLAHFVPRTRSQTVPPLVYSSPCPFPLIPGHT